jgi:hypothetical protein
VHDATRGTVFQNLNTGTVLQALTQTVIWTCS